MKDDDVIIDRRAPIWAWKIIDNCLAGQGLDLTLDAMLTATDIRSLQNLPEDRKTIEFVNKHEEMHHLFTRPKQ